MKRPILRLTLALSLGLSAFGQEFATESITTTVIQPRAILVTGGSNSSPSTDYQVWGTTTPSLGYSQIAAMASGFLTFTDNSVRGGMRYCYVATSYSPLCPATPTCGESANSNEVCTTTSVPIGTQLPKTFFAVSDFGLSLPLTGGISLGTLGRIGGIIGYHIEPTCDGGSNQASSCYDWAPLDAWVNFAVSHRLMLVYAHSVPGWQCGLLSTQTCRTLPPNLTFMANFARALATRYAGKIKYHETLNEVNNPTSGGGWADTCANLVLLHNTIYNAIKAGDPNAIVSAPSMAYGSSSPGCAFSPTNAAGHEWIWLQNFLQTRDRNGNLPQVDTVGAHQYQIVQPALHNVAQRLLNVYNGFRAVMTAAGIPASRPLLVTESSFGPDINNRCGAPLNTTACLTAEGQTAYIGRFLVLAASTWADGGGELPNWYAYDINWGTLNGTHGMNPQNAMAYGQMEQWLTNATFSQQCHAGSPTTVFVCDFTDASNHQAEIIFNDNNGDTTAYTTPGWATHYQQLLGSKTALGGGVVAVGDTPILLTP